jgi:hypothetical protein
MGPPQGGFTDVGKHTGLKARNTVFPLVQAVLLAALQDDIVVKDPYLLNLQMRASFDVWLVQRQLESESLSFGREYVNLIMQMIKSGARLTAQLSESRHAPSDFCEGLMGRIETARRTLDERTLQQWQNIASVSVLDSYREVQHDRIAALAGPDVDIPMEIQFQATASTLESLRQASLRNLEWLPSPPSSDCSISDLWKWLQHQRVKDSARAETMHLALTTIDRVLFYTAVSKLSPTQLHVEPVDVPTLDLIVARYRQTLQRFRTTLEGKELSQTVLRSCEVLILFITYALTHQAALDKFSSLKV